MAYPFLSPEWVHEARRLREEYRGGPAFSQVVKLNLIVTDVPFGDGPIPAHVDTSSGELDVDTGHVSSPDLTVTVDYQTAKAILVDGNSQAAMQAFMAGKVRVEGDMSKLMALQMAPTDGPGEEFAIRLREITA
jgi:hypothetical protein